MKDLLPNEPVLGGAWTRQPEELFRHIADTAPVMIWLAGVDKLCFWFNKPWLDFTGRSMQTEVGNGWASGVHADDFERCMETYVSSFEARRSFEMDYRLLRHDGEYRWLLDHGVARFAPDGSFIGYAGSCIDITERRHMEEALREADQRKDAFIATLAHELRNPLAPIRSGLEILRRTAPRPELFKPHLEVIERQTNQIVSLVDDLLDVSRISGGGISLKRERVVLTAVVELALEACGPLLQKMGQQVVLQLPAEPVVIDADLHRLTQVVINLLTNAAKYSPAGGEIFLQADVDDGFLILRVRDGGVGIAVDMLDRVFDLFVQGEPGDAAVKSGLGVGLSVVKAVVELHGGEVTARSKGAGCGSEFTVRLPGALLVAVSGWGQEEDRRRSREAGFEHHFVKPVAVVALLAVLQGSFEPLV